MIPPWKMQHITIDTTLTTYPKNNTPPEMYRSLTAEIFNQHQNYIKIFTDGSKTITGNGYAVYSADFSFKARLPTNTSVYTAELTAIYQAFKIAYEKHYQRTLILTDSKSTISAIGKKIQERPYN